MYGGVCFACNQPNPRRGGGDARTPLDKCECQRETDLNCYRFQSVPKARPRGRARKVETMAKKKAQAADQSPAPADVSPALTPAEAEQGARNALAVADTSVASQVAVYKALAVAAEAWSGKGGDAEKAAVFEELRAVRSNLLLKVATRTLDLAEQAFAQNGVKASVAAPLKAALLVHEAIGSSGAKVRELQKRARELAIETAEREPAKPFFARFLENQNRQRVSSLQSKPREVRVTLKNPSDHEDPGADLGDDVVVTLKFPSDQEDGGPVTRKFPSDEEDAGCDGIAITMKAPSDHEDGSTTLENTVFVTLKYPSDHDEGESPVETRKFPSDQEDTSFDTLADTPVTMKAPSDHEDGGGGEEVVVTLKAPSDHEDAGTDEGPAQTKKFPSDAEDIGVGDQGPVTLKFPSDEEDCGQTRPGGSNPVTLKYPSDSDEGELNEDMPAVTLKFPSDREDGEPFDPGTITTAKFPSDEEDQGSDLRDTLAVTMKFPSDNDEGDPWIDLGANVTTAKFPSDRDE